MAKKTITRKKTKVVSNVTSKKEASTLLSKMKKQEIDAINNSFSGNSLKMMKKRYLQVDETGRQETPVQMFSRIAKAIAQIEKNYGKKPAEINKIEKDFFGILSSKEYTPAGRTVTNAGAKTSVVANCIVLPVHDSMESIFQTLKDAALLQQVGSGLGFDFSHLRPAFSKTKRTQGVSSGPVSFLRVYDAGFGTIKQQGRHGANMAMMRIDHPDVLDFIRAKKVEGQIRNFNISVKVTDEFMKAVQEQPDKQWYCSWKGQKMKPQQITRSAAGSPIGVEEINITAKEMFDEIINYAWLNGEPGIVFIDEVNRTNPLPGMGEIDCSNPCGEQFLHHYDNCNLGSINLAMFVRNGKINWSRLKKVTKTAVRMMDNIIDLFDFPVEKVTALAQKNRRVGLGIMGFADMLYQLEVPYNSPQGVKLGERVMKTITESAHEMSRELAKEKGSFPNIDLSVYGKKYGLLRRGGIKASKKKVPMRNAALTTVAPTGSIAMMLDSSSGIEPNFALAFVKQDKDGQQYHYLNKHFEIALKKEKVSAKKIAKIKEEIKNTGTVQNLGSLPQKLVKTFVVAMDISAADHMKMQAAFQKNVDNSISKTINFPNSATKEEVAEGFISAWRSGCKSCTVYRDGSREVQILNLGDGKDIKRPDEIGTTIQEVATGSVASFKGTNGLHAKDRPEVMSGKTYRVRIGYGNLFITINSDDNNRPFEVFATIGKAGGYFQEQSEAICRLISTALRAGVSVKEITEQLKGIRGPMPTITERGTIYSLPDAIGQILEEHIGENKKHEIPLFGDGVVAEPTAVIASSSNDSNVTISEDVSKKNIADFGYMPGCPDCGNALHMTEGCMSCSSCGWNRCD